MNNTELIQEIKRVQGNIDRLISTVKLDEEQQELVSNMTHMTLLLQKAMSIAMKEKETEIGNLNSGLAYVENFMNEKGLLADFLQFPIFIRYKSG